MQLKNLLYLSTIPSIYFQLFLLRSPSSAIHKSACLCVLGHVLYLKDPVFEVLPYILVEIILHIEVDVSFVMKWLLNSKEAERPQVRALDF